MAEEAAANRVFGGWGISPAALPRAALCTPRRALWGGRRELVAERWAFVHGVPSPTKGGARE